MISDKEFEIIERMRALSDLAKATDGSGKLIVLSRATSLNHRLPNDVLEHLKRDYENMLAMKPPGAQFVSLGGPDLDRSAEKAYYRNVALLAHAIEVWL